MHNGQKVKYVIYKNQFRITDLASALKVTRRTVYNWLEDKDLKPNVILQIGRVLRHDFSVEFPYYFSSDVFKIPQAPLPGENNAESDYYKDQYLKLLERYNQLLVSMTGEKSLQIVR
ncbi:MAG: hypothetical protein JKY70_15490 [Mucilaginibacter sp.]|nr:hypothetical protein [Mucilaginibacter sp.]